MVDEEEDPLYMSSIISNSSIFVAMKTVPKFNYVHNFINNTDSLDDVDGYQYHFIDNIISSTIIKYEKKISIFFFFFFFFIFHFLENENKK